LALLLEWSQIGVALIGEGRWAKEVMHEKGRYLPHAH
jgi:hypothetical protein